MGMAGTMEGFFATCMETLYPPGACGDVCDASTFQCRLQEINMACCREEACKDGSIVPADCSTECALTFAPFLDECAGETGARFDEGTMKQLTDFKAKCLDQDTTSVVESDEGHQYLLPVLFTQLSCRVTENLYRGGKRLCKTTTWPFAQVEFAKTLLDRGCEITFDGHRRQLQGILDEIKGVQSHSPLPALAAVASNEGCPFDGVHEDTELITRLCCTDGEEDMCAAGADMPGLPPSHGSHCLILQTTPQS